MSDVEIAGAKEEYQRLEQEGKAIQAAIRRLGKNDSSSGEPNRLTIEWTKKTEGNDNDELKVQLSSPVEEATLKKIGDTATFQGVETAQATLTISAGSSTSTAFDVAVFTHQLISALELRDSYSYTLDDVKIGSSSFQLKTTYHPSQKDHRTELFELLNKTVERKKVAMDVLKSAEKQVTAKRSVAVTSGFLNKDKATVVKKEKSKLQIWYERAAFIVPRVKNYVLFGAFVIFCNYRGHYLVIPAPV